MIYKISLELHKSQFKKYINWSIKNYYLVYNIVKIAPCNSQDALAY